MFQEFRFCTGSNFGCFLGLAQLLFHLAAAAHLFFQCSGFLSLQLGFALQCIGLMLQFQHFAPILRLDALDLLVEEMEFFVIIEGFFKVALRL